MEIVSTIVEAALATGFIGYLANRAWRWWRRPRLSIAYDSDQRPKPAPRRGFAGQGPGQLRTFVEYSATVRNDGGRTAEFVEATAEVTAFWDGNRWREHEAIFGPSFLVWAETHETRTHIPPDGWRRLAVFLAGPLEGGVSSLQLAKPATYNADAPSMGSMGPGRSRLRIRVAAVGGETASCELDVDWTKSDPMDLPVEIGEGCSNL